MSFLRLLIAGALWAAPPLTTIQDVLYKADGTPFNGVAFIQWKSFEASDQSNVATHTLAVPIVHGVLRVQLVPSTTGTPERRYSVRYNSEGRIQFEETWAVPPSATPLRVRDVRVATPVTPPPVTEPIQESDVTGLVSDLAARPVKGPGFAASRVAIISASGALEAPLGNLTDCVRVDGSAGPCGTGGGAGPAFVDSETLSGLLNGTNPVFTLSNSPSPASSLAVYRNGLLQKRDLDYTLSGNVVTFVSGAVPQPGDVLAASYRLDGGAGPQPFTLPQVLCSTTGASTGATSLTSLGTCTAAAGLLSAGDRVEIRFEYSHQGATSGFSAEVRWGATALAGRTADSSETLIAGRSDAAIRASGAQWSTQSWGGSLALAVSAGTASDSLAAPLIIDFLGGLSASGTDTVTLEHLTVIRYPAQSNP